MNHLYLNHLSILALINCSQMAASGSGSGPVRPSKAASVKTDLPGLEMGKGDISGAGSLREDMIQVSKCQGSVPTSTTHIQETQSMAGIPKYH